jgi:uncharacterized cupredoxin-like copper-binding protein
MHLVRIVARARWTAFLGLAAALVAVGAWAGGGRAGGRVVSVGERDFAITAPKHLAAGDITLRVHNRGPDDHELIVVRSDDGLPLRKDGLTVNEETLGKAEVGALEPGAPGKTRQLHVHLAPGRYLLLCNMQGHYLGGMRSVLVVR